MSVTADVRFTLPLYTSTEAAGYLGVPAATFATWVEVYREQFPDRPPVTGDPLVNGLPPEERAAPSIPFGGLGEGMFLSALHQAVWSMLRATEPIEDVAADSGIPIDEVTEVA